MSFVTVLRGSTHGVLFAMVLYPGLFFWVQKWQQKLNQITCTLYYLATCKVTIWKVRQLMNSRSKFGKWQEHCGICCLTLKQKSFTPLPVWEATVLLAVYFLQTNKKNCSFLQEREHSVTYSVTFLCDFPEVPCLASRTRGSLFKDAVSGNESKIYLRAYIFVLLFRKYILEKRYGSRLLSFL